MSCLFFPSLSRTQVPKFLKPDLPLFAGIISDLFPVTKKPSIDYGELLNALVATCKEDGLQPTQPFLDKCLQLYDTVVVRHGVMLVGPTGSGQCERRNRVCERECVYLCASFINVFFLSHCCYCRLTYTGKSRNLHTLQKAMTRLKHLPSFSKVHITCLNPKAVTLDQLYGYSDPYSNEWSDGILAGIFRETIEESSKNKKLREWVCFDGPVDAVWIESMNTVLDDNKKL